MLRVILVDIDAMITDYFRDNLGFDPAVFEPLDNDLNKDGVIDDADVALMMEHWLDEILWP